MLQLSVLILMLAKVYITSGVIPNPSGNLEVYALPVGQGDCTIIQCPSGQLIINDCGSSGGPGWNAGVVSNYLGARVNDIIAILISHGNRDHYNYLPTITNSMNMNIQSVIIGGTVTDYPASFRNWLNDFGTRLRLINNGGSCIGNCAVPGGTNFCNNANIKFNILAANVGPSANEKSIVLKVIIGAFSMLLPGDMEDQASLTIAQMIGPQLQSYVYKMAHHGASTKANLQNWLNPIRPEIAFASSAYNRGNCRHPRCDTIMRLQQVDTITTAQVHPFYCGNNPGAPTNYPAFNESMYETSPTASTICQLTFVSTGTFSQQCTQVSAIANSQVSGGDLDGDDCFAVTETASTLHCSRLMIMISSLLVKTFAV